MIIHCNEAASSNTINQFVIFVTWQVKLKQQGQTTECDNVHLNYKFDAIISTNIGSSYLYVANIIELTCFEAD